MEFVAQSAATPLSFIGTASAGGKYLGLDNVSVIVAPNPWRLTAVSFVGKAFRFEIPPNPIREFVVEGRADFATGEWIPVANVEIRDQGDVREVIVQRDMDAPRQFYRVRIP